MIQNEHSSLAGIVTSLALAIASLSGARLGYAAEVASVISADPRVSLTIYNSDLALIEEVRALDLPAGRARLELRDVSARIRPETVTLAAPGLSIVEQNFDFDLLTPEKLMEKAVGRQVQIVRTNPGNGQEITEAATVLSVNQGVVLKIGERIEVLRADGTPTRVIFDKVPETLRARPTLSVTVTSEHAGAREARLSYLSTGLSWKADYVALFDENAGALDLQGWVTLTNSSGSTFANAQTQLVAGEINMLRADAQTWDRGRSTRGPGRQSGQRRVGDYYVYPLSARTTIADNQTKQVGFLDVTGVRARKTYEYRASGFESLEEPDHAASVVRFENSVRSGLGSELPGGVVRVYMRDQAGRPTFVGENSIVHTPQGSELSVEIGEAFDITVQPTLVSHERAGFWRSRYKMEYAVRNAKSEEVTVELRQQGLWREGKVLNESAKSRRVDANTLEWTIVVPANGESKLAFTVETGW